jgi:predicted transcriptional regulator of viral defense system
MARNITSLGSKEGEFLTTFSGSGRNVFNFGEASGFWGSSLNARTAIHRLVQKGWLAQIEKGKYLIIPFEAGNERHWSEDPYIIAGHLVKPAAVAYWSAIRHWNWTEQIPRIIYVQTTKRKNNPRPVVFGVKYEFVTVNERKFFGNIKEWRGGKPMLVTDREKTLLDCADDFDRAGGIEELAKAVRNSASEISWDKLGVYARQFPNAAVRKRLGYLFETLVPNLTEQARAVLEHWRKDKSSGIARLQPSLGKKGKISTRWRVLVNVEV